MFLAVIEPGSYLDFARPVPFKDSDGYPESGLLNERGRLSGRAQAAVRPISTPDFLRILEMGLDEPEPVLPREGSHEHLPGLGDMQDTFEFETERPRVQQLTSRVARDRVFRRVVLRAYGERCAITSLKLINGLGRAEVDAAHIRPVEHNGPDIIHNGIALSGTVHWMFDRGLISLSDDLDILISWQVNDIDSVRALINKNGKANPPARAHDLPQPRFLAWHRENCFKG